MWVIKLGGSLGDAPVLLRWLDTVARQGRGRAVIVPGGGAFAEQVRIAQQQWRFDDLTAHRMAIVAMRQTALMLHGLNAGLCLAGSVAQIRAALRQNRAVLWSPDYRELDDAGIAASWDITSDSLAAWLAAELRASALVLVKSAQIPVDADFNRLAEQGIIDAAFAGFAAKLDCPVSLLHRNELPIFSNCLGTGTAGT